MRVLAVNDDLPIRTFEPVHSGKVRAVYWLSEADNRRLIRERQYPIPETAELAVMVISDRLSAFECMWRAEGGLDGVPGKGAALNAISGHWFEAFKKAGLARSHILETPHPLVWIVQRAKPVMIEAIARQYITGSMWRAYEQGDRRFCGVRLPDGLVRHQRLDSLLITPSTKGVMSGIPGVPEVDDVNVSQAILKTHWAAFKFREQEDVEHYARLLASGFSLIETALAGVNQIFVDTKFEFGYAQNRDGTEELIYMDEVGTPDSSRIWDGDAFARGDVVENSKEGFRQALLNFAADPDVLLNKSRMDERLAFARNTVLPTQMMLDVSKTYVGVAERIMGEKLDVSDDPRTEIIQVLRDNFDIIDPQ
ncbi:phosphoribosylaminoimidazolesuccinocarboxamide synthase [Luminiphilus sp.]|nr:phosphoribosylaminoimidazolesuccinocarboxamide synthase [Luminiphilus sp.]